MVTFTDQPPANDAASTGSVRHMVRRVLETAGRLIFGQEMRLVSGAELDRLHRLAYRERLRQAEQAGDHAFIEAELQRNQLNGEDLQRIARHHTPLEEWPDTPDDLLEAEDAPPPESHT